MSIRSRFGHGVKAVGLLLVAGLSLLTPSVAHAGVLDYVAMGDSYSSGVGTDNYYSDGTNCLRSPQAAGPRLASSLGLRLTFVACSGATTSSVASQQLGVLSSTTGQITLTVGGNDAGFSTVLTECAKPSWWGDCTGAIASARSVVTNQLPGRLASLYGQIKSRAPNATVIVAGYPRLFMGVDCNAGTFFSADEMTKLNAMADQLNSVIRSRATAAGFRYVDPVASFTGHAVCSSTEWVNGLSWPIVESFHPNAAGHAAYAALYRPTMRTGSQLTSAAEAPVLPKITGGSELVTVPDLTSPQAKAAAARAGITPTELASLSQAQRQGATGAQLTRLDQHLTQK